MSKISRVHAREILDSRGNPTVEVEVTTDSGVMARAAVPSGASTGAHEACELRDGDKTRYLGKGVQNAVAHAVKDLGPKIVGMQITQQTEIDQALNKIDGTDNKSKMGANAILGISMAVAKAAALVEGLPLYKYLGGSGACKLPVPLINVLNGGAHANNGMEVQEFMIVPVVGGKFSESLRAGAETFHALKTLLAKKGHSVAVGDEGGFAPKLKNNQEALELLMEAISKAGYTAGKDIYLGLDVAATEFYKDGKYAWEGQQLSGEQMLKVYEKWQSQFPLITMEDGFSEDDWDSWGLATAKLGGKMQLVGDDLFVTNPKRLKMGFEKKIANSLLVKVNQIGTLSETRQAVQLAQEKNYTTVMSHRSGETEDATIADFAVGLNCSQIKTGSMCRGERTAKYNQLLRIEEELGSKAQYWGLKAFNQKH